MARVFQIARYVKRLGADKASWYVAWSGADGSAHKKSYGPGANGKKRAERQKRDIEAQRQREIFDGVWTAPDESVWVGVSLIDPHYGEIPAGPWPYPRICWPRLYKLTHDVDSYGAPPVPGKIRRYHLPETVGCKGGKNRRRLYVYNLEDARQVERDAPRPLDEVKGDWLTADIFQRNDGKLYVTVYYLTEKSQDRPAWPFAADGKPVVAYSQWFDFCKEHSVDLDPAVDGGRLESLRKKKPGARLGTTVFSLEQAKQIVNRRTNPDARKTTPDGKGEFLDGGELLNHSEWGVCVSNERGERECKQYRGWVDKCVTHRQPGLDPRINNGKARCLCEPKPIAHKPGTPGARGKGGFRRRYTCLADLKKQAAWLKELKARGTIETNPGLANAATSKEIAKRVRAKGKQGMKALGIALIAFRNEQPKSASRRFTWTGNGGFQQPRYKSAWRYDLKAFLNWMNRRNVFQVAASFAKRRAEVTTNGNGPVEAPATVNGQTTAAERGRPGRKIDPETLAVYKVCHEEFTSGQGKRSEQLRRVQTRIENGSEVVPDISTMRVYARRFSNFQTTGKITKNA